MNGSACRWARVLAFELPRRLVISWNISPTWQLETDPARASEVEVEVIPEGPSQTRVELEHRHFKRHGEGWRSVRTGAAGEGRWPLYLQRFVDVRAA